MEDALEQIQTKDSKERMAGVERLVSILEHTRKGLSANEVESLVNASLVLLKDNNFRVLQGSLHALASAAALAGEHLKCHFHSLLPAIVERLGDGKQPVRDAGRQLLLALMEISSPTVIVERARSFAWGHRKWRVREEFARTVASAVNLFAATELPFLRMLLPSVLRLLEDSNDCVREAAMLCLEEMYRQGGSQFRDELECHQIRPAQVNDITCRLNNIEPVRYSSEHVGNEVGPDKEVRDIGQCAISERKLSIVPAAARRNSLRVKSAQTESTILGCREAGELQADAIRVYSDKELVKEIEKAAGMLTPEQDWSVRIAAMQKLEGLVAGGATEYASFNSQMKQLVAPLSGQLSDRRSSIVKQACQLLNLLSRELRVHFEIYAEAFIPVLFKLVVITVLVIAESADVCIKNMLRHCRVSRVLPKLIECAKHDRNAVLRARCCEYAVLVLEEWGASPEIQRSVDLYEDLIKCCVGDAVSEVRSSARMCHRVFSKCWPQRAARMMGTFDASVQKVLKILPSVHLRQLLNEERGVPEKWLVFPPAKEWGSEQPFKMPVPGNPHQATYVSITSACSNTSTVNADKGTSISSALAIPVINRPYPRTSAELLAARSLARVLQGSQQEVIAIEHMLRRGERSDNCASGSHDLSTKGSENGALSKSPKVALNDQGGSYTGTSKNSITNYDEMDCTSASDPDYPALVLAPNQFVSHATSRPAESAASSEIQAEGSLSSGSFSGFENFTAQPVETGRARHPHSQIINADQRGNELLSNLSAASTARRLPQQKSLANWGDLKGPKRVMRTDSADKGMEKKEMDSAFTPGFQRPLLRQTSSGNARSNMDENLVLAQLIARGEILKCTEIVMPLTDALTEGLSVRADWAVRVAAFTFLRKVLQQGPKGLQEVNQNFVMVMKLFSAHLDDPHHKVAHAALSTLAELVPVCRKSFEAYLERILPQVFGRLVDAKEVIRQLGNTVLEAVGNTFTIDSLLPTLLRSLDEQRSPKVKMRVIEFAMVASDKLVEHGEASGGTGFLKLWLAKLCPLAHDKNSKLKEAAVTGIISVYSHFDPVIVLNFILGLSVEEQSLLRRSLKQRTPRIEVDLMAYIQNKSHRGRAKFVHDNSDSVSGIPGIFAEPVKIGYSNLTGDQALGACRLSRINSDRGRKWESTHDSTFAEERLNDSTFAATELNEETPQSCETSRSTKEVSFHSIPESGRMKKMMNGVKGIDWRSAILAVRVKEVENHTVECRKHPSVHFNELVNFEEMVNAGAFPEESQVTVLQSETRANNNVTFLNKVNNKVQSQEFDSPVPKLLQQIATLGSMGPIKSKYETLLQLIMLRVNDHAAWSEYFNRILMVIVESMDDIDIAVKELALSATFDILRDQKPRLDEFTEVLLEKLLQTSMDPDPKVSTAADRCRTVMLTDFDVHCCLSVVVRLLVSDDEKSLITCIGSLTMLVIRLAPEKLIVQLPSFLPALINAFGNENADVRKTVVFCLVDIYIVLGDAFVPYLGHLSSSQLRLVTIYATRISQARTNASLGSGNWKPSPVSDLI